MEKRAEVVAALVRRGERFMICRRPENKARGGLWEFVGGKVEPGETKEEALARECKEELDVSLSVGALFCEVTHVYPDLTVHLSLFEATIASGEPRLLEHTALKWIAPREIPLYDFCPADRTLLEKIVQSARTPLEQALADLRDEAYRSFQAPLLPTLDPARILGVRFPALRAFAKEFSASPEAKVFLSELPHYYFEENNLHALLLEKEKDPSALVKKLDAFLPFVDNWATCDTIIPKAFLKHGKDLYPHVLAAK